MGVAVVGVAEDNAAVTANTDVWGLWAVRIVADRVEAVGRARGR